MAAHTFSRSVASCSALAVFPCRTASGTLFVWMYGCMDVVYEHEAAK